LLDVRPKISSKLFPETKKALINQGLIEYWRRGWDRCPAQQEGLLKQELISVEAAIVCQKLVELLVEHQKTPSFLKFDRTTQK
jgi:hypothetical protein